MAIQVKTFEFIVQNTNLKPGSRSSYTKAETQPMRREEAKQYVKKQTAEFLKKMSAE